MISKNKLQERIEELENKIEILKDEIHILYKLTKEKEKELETMKFEQKHPNGVIDHGLSGDDRFTCKHVHSYRYAANGKVNKLFLTNTEDPVLPGEFKISRINSNKILITYEDRKWLIDTIRNIKMEIPSELYEYKC